MTERDKQEVASSGMDRRKTIGWVSPSYTQSRPARLDAEFIAENRCVGFFADAAEVELYRLLRTKILHRTLGQGGTTMMVTSALPGEGKTLTAINLSFTMAREFGQTVLLVDADLRQQSIHKTLGIPGEKGLVDYILDNAPVQDLIVWPGVEKLTLISGGRTLHASSEVLGSPRMKGLASEMKTRYRDRYVIFDVPPVLSAADALAFAPFIDYVMMVVQAGKTPLRDVQKALEMLPREKILGFVLNRHEIPSKGYYYYYPKHSR